MSVASQGYSAHMVPLKPLSRFGPCESVPRGVRCVRAVCVCVWGVSRVLPNRSYSGVGQTWAGQGESSWNRQFH